MLKNVKSRKYTSELLGAAFLMATSAVGPGFLNNTTVFTMQLAASFGFVILLSIVLDIFAQINIWRIITISGKPAQDIANSTLPGAGFVLSVLIALGGLAFNIGNIAGCGLGLRVLTGLDLNICVIISTIFAIGIFLFKEAGKAMDAFTKLLGVLMIVMIVYVCFVSHPPLGEAALRTIAPTRFDPYITVALVGGTVGGYITFAGAHRLLDAGVSGLEHLPEVNRGASMGILITSLIRFLLFLASFAVISLGVKIDPENPAASVFQSAAGELGYKIFGIVLFSAAITSVVGAAYTSVSFIRTLHGSFVLKQRALIIGFIVFSALAFLTVGKPIKVLVMAGILNGFILPIALGLILIAANRTQLVENYKHPKWMQIGGWFVVIVMVVLSIYTMFNDFGKLWQ